MDDISSFLKKFKRIISSDDEERKIIAEEISIAISKNILPENISLNSKTVTIKASPVIKNEIFVQQSKILKKIQQKGFENIKTLR